MHHLAHVLRELTILVDDGQDILSYRQTYLMVTDGKVPAGLIEYIRGRYYVRRSNLPAFAEALGLRLNPSSLPPAAELAAKPEPASKPARARASTRRSAA